MTHQERFHAIMNYQPVDRMPVYYFGTWRETKERWRNEGLLDVAAAARSGGPQLPEMDPDWEDGMWDLYGLVNPNPISTAPAAILDETDTHRVIRTPLGAVHRESKSGSSIPAHLEEALAPTRESWERFCRFLDVDAPGRVGEEWDATIERLNESDRVIPFLAGSLFGWPREWLGIEAWSYLAFDDPVLFEDIIATLTEHYITLYRPVLEAVRFDFAYFFEDCCSSTGPLLSPPIYTKYYDKYYRRLIDFYHEMGVPLVLLDSDGKTDALIPLWMDSGVDILFPIEVGTWQTDPVVLRSRFGQDLRMMGGIDKHVIPRGESAIREHLEHRLALVEEGGYIPIPDHRIPPDCSLDDFRKYLDIFSEYFA